MAMQKPKSAKSIPAHLAHIVPIESPVLPEDEARKKGSAKSSNQEFSPAALRYECVGKKLRQASKSGSQTSI